MRKTESLGFLPYDKLLNAIWLMKRTVHWASSQAHDVTARAWLLGKQLFYQLSDSRNMSDLKCLFLL